MAKNYSFRLYPSIVGCITRYHLKTCTRKIGVYDVLLEDGIKRMRIFVYFRLSRTFLAVKSAPCSREMHAVERKRGNMMRISYRIYVIITSMENLTDERLCER